MFSRKTQSFLASILAVILGASGALTPAFSSAAIVFHAGGTATDLSTGEQGPLSLDGSSSFTSVDSSATSETSTFAGSATVGGSRIPIWWIPPIIVKLLVNKILADLPPPRPLPFPRPIYLCALTGENMTGTFAVNDPNFQANGTFTRTPAGLDVDMNTTYAGGLDGLLPSYTAQAVTTPAGPGAANETVQMSAAMTGGGTHVFTIGVQYAFNAALTLPGAYSTSVSENVVQTGDTFDFTGTTHSENIPEPGSLALGAAAVGVASLNRRRRVISARDVA